MKQYLFFAIIATVACGCDDGLFESVIDENPKLVEQLMTGATETLTIGPNTFVLEAFLWRDFMPILEETNFDGRSMIAINWLVDVNSVVVPANISLVRQHVIYGNLVWTSAYEDEAPAPSLPPPTSLSACRETARNGGRTFMWI